MSTKTQIDLSIVLPQIGSEDECIDILLGRLAGHRGIEKAHVAREDDSAKLCLHYDPNLVSLATVERIAREAGAEVADRYRHEQLPFAGLNTADAALSSKATCAV